MFAVVFIYKWCYHTNHGFCHINHAGLNILGLSPQLIFIPTISTWAHANSTHGHKEMESNLNQRACFLTFYTRLLVNHTLSQLEALVEQTLQTILELQGQSPADLPHLSLLHSWGIWTGAYWWWLAVTRLTAVRSPQSSGSLERQRDETDQMDRHTDNPPPYILTFI